MITDLDYAQAAIDMLPESVDEIAAFFRVHKIKGRRQSAFHCPIANWVMRWTDTQKVSVATFVYVGDHDNPIKSTKAMTDFMYAFDSKRIVL